MQNNTIILTYWSYRDPLIQAYTLPYVRMIRRNLSADSVIFLMTLEKDARMLTNPAQKEIRETLEGNGVRWMPFAYKPLGIGAAYMWMVICLKLSAVILGNKISTLHCWCTPAGAIGYLMSTLFGTRLVIDSYEPHAEAMVENGTWKRGGFAHRLLFWLERKQTKRASTIIATTAGMKSYASEKYGQVIERFYVKPACVDLLKFSRNKIKDAGLLKELELTGKIVCVYAGKLGGIYLENETFDFFRVASDFWGDRFRVMFLSSHTKDEIEYYCSHAGLDPAIVKIKFVPHAEVPVYMGLGDFAITPVKPVPTKRYCTPIKDGEYWALGLPIVIPAQISDDSDIIATNNAGAILNRFDGEQYLLAVQKIDSLLREDSQSLFLRINALAVQYRSFQIAERVYEQVYSKGI